MNRTMRLIRVGQSVWYRWTAPANGPWAFDTRGSSFDTLLGIYTGSSVGGLVACGEQRRFEPGHDQPCEFLRDGRHGLSDRD